MIAYNSVKHVITLVRGPMAQDKDNLDLIKDHRPHFSRAVKSKIKALRQWFKNDHFAKLWSKKVYANLDCLSV